MCGRVCVCEIETLWGQDMGVGAAFINFKQITNKLELSWQLAIVNPKSNPCRAAPLVI